jgi:transposase
VFQDTASALFGVEGLQVTDAQALPDGTLEVWAVTGHPAAAACPDCGTVSARRHDTVLARPRDVRRGGDLVAVCWVKHRWKCDEPGCDRKTFTERVPQVPPRCRLTARLREQARTEVVGRGVTPAEAARHAGISWPVAHEAFAAAADPVLGQAPAPVAHLGIDEHRRGRPRRRTDEQTGEYLLLADRWHTCFFDLSGEQGLLGQVEGRTADDAAYWLAQATRPGGTRSGWWRSTCAPFMPPRSAGCCPAADRGGLVPRGAPGREDDRRRAPPGGPRQVRPPRPVR